VSQARRSASISVEKKPLRITQKRYSNLKEQMLDTPTSVSQFPKIGTPRQSVGIKEKELDHKH
jgi:hypothetical protein